MKEKYIPTGWRKMTLGDVIEVIGGGTPKTTIDSYWNGDISWLSVVDFNSDDRWVSRTEKTITQEGLSNSSTKLLNSGDIIISARGTVGALAQLKVPMAFNQSCYGIRELEGISDKNYLYYLIKFQVKQISKNVHGAVFDTITRNTFDSINIFLPPLSEQRAIADMLSSLDTKIELLREQNETLEKTAQTIFNERFGRYSVENPEEFPGGWSVGKIGEVDFITFGDGNYSAKYPKQSDFVMEGIPFISNKDLSNGMILSDDLRYISHEQHSVLKKGHLKQGDILISTRANIGDIALVSSEFEDANINAQLVFIRTDNPEIYSNFLYIIFSSKKYRSIFESYSSGSAQAQLPMHALRQIQIIIPTEQKIKEFSYVMNPIFHKIQTNNSQIQSLSKTRNTLLPKLMSGEVRIV